MDIDYIKDKIENGGVNAQGRLSADEFNSVVNQVRDNRDAIKTKAPLVTRVSHIGWGEVSVTPNVMHVWNRVTGVLTLTLEEDASTEYNEYMMEMTMGEEGSVVFPRSVRWAEEPDFTTGNTYCISIVDNLGVWAEFEKV